MEFKVYTASGEEPCHGASRYEIGSGNGVLTVSGDDGKTIVYDPVAWAAGRGALRRSDHDVTNSVC
jgi:hypothetical protein